MDEDLVDEIFTNNETDGECLKAMLEVWLQKSINPTWKDVTDALSKIGKNQLNHRCRITVVMGMAEAAQKWSGSKQREFFLFFLLDLSRRSSQHEDVQSIHAEWDASIVQVIRMCEQYIYTR